MLKYTIKLPIMVNGRMQLVECNEANADLFPPPGCTPYYIVDSSFNDITPYLPSSR